MCYWRRRILNYIKVFKIKYDVFNLLKLRRVILFFDNLYIIIKEIFFFLIFNMLYINDLVIVLSFF